MHSTGVRVAASNSTTWPLATKASEAWVCVRLNNIMWGRTGSAPVRARHNADVSAPRSTFAVGAAEAVSPASVVPAKMYNVPPCFLPGLSDWSTTQTSYAWA